MMVTRARDPGPFVREIEHTADLGLEVEAPSLPLLFERAGLGMLALMIDLAAVEPRERGAIALEAEDREALLHDWLPYLLVRLQAGPLAVSELDRDPLPRLDRRSEEHPAELPSPCNILCRLL